MTSNYPQGRAAFISWSPEQIAILENLYRPMADGRVLSIGRVAKNFNKLAGTAVTRSAILGKARRLGFDVKYPRSKRAADRLGVRNKEDRQRSPAHYKPTGRPRGRPSSDPERNMERMDQHQRESSEQYKVPKAPSLVNSPFGAHPVMRLTAEDRAALKAREEAEAISAEDRVNCIPFMDASDKGLCTWPMGKHEGVEMACGNKRYDNGSRLRPTHYCTHHLRIGSQAVRQRAPSDATPFHAKRARGNLNRF